MFRFIKSKEVQLCLDALKDLEYEINQNGITSFSTIKPELLKFLKDKKWIQKAINEDKFSADHIVHNIILYIINSKISSWVHHIHVWIIDMVWSDLTRLHKFILNRGHEKNHYSDEDVKRMSDDIQKHIRSGG